LIKNNDSFGARLMGLAFLKHEETFSKILEKTNHQKGLFFLLNTINVKSWKILNLDAD